MISSTASPGIGIGGVISVIYYQYQYYHWIFVTTGRDHTNEEEKMSPYKYGLEIKKIAPHRVRIQSWQIYSINSLAKKG